MPVNTEVPQNVLNDIRKSVDAALGRKDERNWKAGHLRSIFDTHIGALVCRHCGTLNVPDALVCSQCELAYEVSIFVGNKVDHTSVETVQLTEPGSILSEQPNT